MNRYYLNKVHFAQLSKISSFIIRKKACFSNGPKMIFCIIYKFYSLKLFEILQDILYRMKWYYVLHKLE